MDLNLHLNVGKGMDKTKFLLYMLAILVYG